MFTFGFSPGLRLWISVVKKAKMWRKKESAHGPKHTWLLVKPSGGRDMVWVCMAAFGASSLIFIDDVTYDGSSRTNLQKHSVCYFTKKTMQQGGIP